MIARVKENGKGKYVIQYRPVWFGWTMFWWSNYDEMEANYEGDVYTTAVIYETLDIATQAMIELVLKDEKRDLNAKKTSVVAEVTTEQVREKFPQFFI